MDLLKAVIRGMDYAYLSCMDGIAFGCLAAWISARIQMSRQ